MILPSDSDPPPDRNEGDNPTEEPDDDTNWWEEGENEGNETGSEGLLPDELDALPDDLDDPDSPQLQSIAGPGWRNDLYKDLLESLRDLEAIEDPDDEFAPPEPPDLYTFFGELAALRHEFRDHGQRTQHALNKLVQTLPAAANPPVRRKGKGSSDGAGAAAPWPMETCLALISVWDLLPHAASAGAFASSLQPLLQAAGLTRIPTLAMAFNPETMTLAGTVIASGQVVPGTVVEETCAGFLRDGNLVRPAGVIIAGSL